MGAEKGMEAEGKPFTERNAVHTGEARESQRPRVHELISKSDGEAPGGAPEPVPAHGPNRPGAMAIASLPVFPPQLVEGLAVEISELLQQAGELADPPQASLLQHA